MIKKNISSGVGILIIVIVAVLVFTVFSIQEGWIILPSWCKSTPAPIPVSIPKTALTEYRHDQYGFKVSLPENWKGYSIVTDMWEGFGGENNMIIENGPEISIRHPQWTAQNPRQDIPIMIFTISQWESLLSDSFHIGAAPINPSEIGRNTKYVFAIPARYNYAFPEGYQEVEDILRSKFFQSF